MENIKTIGEFLDFLIETNNNSKSDFFFSYEGHINAILISAAPKGWESNQKRLYFNNVLYLDQKDIPKLATEMVEWIKENRVPKEPEVEHA